MYCHLRHRAGGSGFACMLEGALSVLDALLAVFVAMGLPPTYSASSAPTFAAILIQTLGQFGCASQRVRSQHGDGPWRSQQFLNCPSAAVQSKIRTNRVQNLRGDGEDSSEEGGELGFEPPRA